MEASLEIQALHHLPHVTYVARMLEIFEHIEELLTAHCQSIRVKRVHRDVRWQVVILRSRARIMMGAHHHSDGGRIKVKKRVDTFPARSDGDGPPGFE